MTPEEIEELVATHVEAMLTTIVDELWNEIMATQTLAESLADRVGVLERTLLRRIDDSAN